MQCTESLSSVLCTSKWQNHWLIIVEWSFAIKSVQCDLCCVKSVTNLHHNRSCACQKSIQSPTSRIFSTCSCVWRVTLYNRAVIENQSPLRHCVEGEKCDRSIATCVTRKLLLCARTVTVMSSSWRLCLFVAAAAAVVCVSVNRFSENKHIENGRVDGALTATNHKMRFLKCIWLRDACAICFEAEYRAYSAAIIITKQ